MVVLACFQYRVTADCKVAGREGESCHQYLNPSFIGCQCRQEMKIPNFTDSERFETPKTDCMLKFYKDKEFYQLGFQVC